MSDGPAKIPVARCPICGKPAVDQQRPFCSRRCALIDLGRWIGGNYRMPAEQDDEESDAPGDGSDEGGEDGSG
jgi:uncharacterized protein